MLYEVFNIKGNPIWFFTPYSFIIDIRLYTDVKEDIIYDSNELILEDKRAIQEEITHQYFQINKEIVFKIKDLEVDIQSFQLLAHKVVFNA